MSKVVEEFKRQVENVYINRVNLLVSKLYQEWKESPSEVHRKYLSHIVSLIDEILNKPLLKEEHK